MDTQSQPYHYRHTIVRREEPLAVAAQRNVAHNDNIWNIVNSIDSGDVHFRTSSCTANTTRLGPPLVCKCHNRGTHNTAYITLLEIYRDEEEQ